MENIRYDFHKHKTYWECPKKFKLQYDRVGPTVPQNGYYRVAGEFVQKFFEMYSNVWKESGSNVNRFNVRKKMTPYWSKLQKWNPIDWGAPMSRKSEPELFAECLDIIEDNLDKLDVYDGTTSELKFVVTLKSGDVLVGKVDFIKTTEDGSVIILDGKNSGTMGKNVDPRQLIFYALLYKFKYGRYPDKIGFLYYKFQQIEYIPFTEESVQELWAEIVRTMVHIKKAKIFPATPCAKSCRYCDYLNTCEEGTADMNSRKRGKKDYFKDASLKKTEDGLYCIGL